MVSNTANEELLALEAAADFLCVSKSTLYRLLERGDVKGRKVGRQWRFRKADLQAYLERGPHAVVLSSVLPSAVDALLPSLGEASAQMGAPLPETADAAPTDEKLAAYVDHLLRLAIAARASDVHLIPTRRDVQVSMRIDGVLHEMARMPEGAFPAVVGQLKQMSGISLEERGIPQDGRMLARVAEEDFDVRVSLLPTVFGESVVLRIFQQANLRIGLDRLFFTPEDLARFRRWLGAPNGLVLCTGPTGSGKTTVMYSGLLEIAGPAKNTLTVEDPVEMILPHTRQVAVNRRLGLTFPAALRAMQRQDPDIIMVGEIRDLETGEIAVQAAMTGHLVLSTLHTKGAAEGMLRLVEMGILPFMVDAALLGLSNQRLVRAICPECAEAVALPAELAHQVAALAAAGGFPLPAGTVFARGRGCAQCGGRGYRGRIALYELIEGTPGVREAFRRGATAEELTRVAVAEGMHTLFADGIRKAAEGRTTLEEVFRVLGMAAPR